MMSAVALHRAVRLTARGSAVLFAAAEATPALRPRAGRAARRLYLGFLVTHAAHFIVVAEYAVVTQGRNLFPGGRSLDEAGGWPTVAGIYTAFATVALAGFPPGPGSSGQRQPRLVGSVARALIGTLFVGTYLGQLRQSRWYAVPAVMVGAAVIARFPGRTNDPHCPSETGGPNELRRRPAAEEVSRATRATWGERLMTALRGALTVDTKSPPLAYREDRKADEATTTTTFGPVSTETPQRNVRQAARSPR